MSGPAVGLWLFEPREFGDILTDTVPWLESFCEPVETKVGSGLEFWVRDGSAVGLSALDPTPGVGVFFLSEDEEIPAEDEDYSLLSPSPVQGLVLGAGCSGPANHQVLGHLALALAERLDVLIDFDGLLRCPTPRDDAGNEGLRIGREHGLPPSPAKRLTTAASGVISGQAAMRVMFGLEVVGPGEEHPGEPAWGRCGCGRRPRGPG